MTDVQNWFRKEGHGFAPIFLGMGASTFAFASARNAVFTEGATDFILLPSLLREALGIRFLGYQVVPGLSEIPSAAVPFLDLEAARTAYALDGDAAASCISRKLQENGVFESLIVHLGGCDSGLSIEDVISPGVYASAVNDELRRSHGDSLEINAKDLPSAGRAAWLEKLCKRRSLNAPQKRAIATRILEMKQEYTIVQRQKRPTLVRLHGQIVRILQTDAAKGTSI